MPRQHAFIINRWIKSPTPATGLTDVLIVATVASRPAADADIQCALISPTLNIVHEDGQPRVGSEIGDAYWRHHWNGPRPGQAQLTAHDPGVGLAVGFPEVVADGAPLAIEVDLDPTR